MQYESLCRDVNSIRQLKPIIHNLTNLVVMQQTANALLALGASPIMAHAEEELEDIVSLANAVVINMGTLDSVWVERARLCLEIAAKLKKLVVFDPVGVGASDYRNQVAKEILQASSVNVIRGNATEILALAGSSIDSSGVDSMHASNTAIGAAKQLSQRHQSVVVVSGEVDYIVSTQAATSKVTHGVAMQQRVTGMGCTSTAIVAAFLAVNCDCHEACVNAMNLMGLAAEGALEKSPGPGSLAMHFFDALYAFKVSAYVN
ncbi:MAG: hydroxyethylthiazole kinase [Gammaproteobacteria bacterium]|nr:hydroxyethylthiazole kinase [Gammaproteobacteria bacterium]MCH9743419.1 hydroxyethylthiazole kinase [Gammaproteobacteria bacterium]